MHAAVEQVGVREPDGRAVRRDGDPHLTAPERVSERTRWHQDLGKIREAARRALEAVDQVAPPSVPTGPPVVFRDPDPPPLPFGVSMVGPVIYTFGTPEQ